MAEINAEITRAGAGGQALLELTYTPRLADMLEENGLIENHDFQISTAPADFVVTVPKGEKEESMAVATFTEELPETKILIGGANVSMVLGLPIIATMLGTAKVEELKGQLAA